MQICRQKLDPLSWWRCGGGGGGGCGGGGGGGDIIPLPCRGRRDLEIDTNIARGVRRGENGAGGDGGGGGNSADKVSHINKQT